MLRSLGTLALCTSLLGLGACFESTELPDGLTEAAGTDDASSTAGETDTGPTEADCQTYCDLMEACEGDNEMYSTQGPCMAVCMNLDLGNNNDQTGNTVGCRTHYAILANEGGDQMALNCRRAGPSGDGACGSPCESFCRIASTTCIDGNQAFPTEGDCVTACMGWVEEPIYNTGVPDEDTYACRLKHLTYATIGPDLHCSHVQDEGGPCVGMAMP